MLTMKKIIATIALTILFGTFSFGQSTISLERYASYRDCEDRGCQPPENLEYIADLNNSLSRFLGTWKGVENGKKIIYKIDRYLYDEIGDVKKDALIIRYKLIDLNTGQTLLDTMELPDDELPVILGLNYINDLYYALYYGHDNCDPYGYVALKHSLDLRLGDQLNIDFILSRDSADESICTAGANQLLIPDNIPLTRI